jgi:hypothetical protein
MSVKELFLRITGHLDRAGIAYMVVGSFASSYYGAVRSTKDIDIVIEADASQIRSLVTVLSDEFYAELGAALDALASRSMFNLIDNATGWKIDLIMPKQTPYNRAAFLRRRPVRIQEVPLFVATAEDVIVSKLEWARMSESKRQIQDVARVLQLQTEILDHSYLDRWIQELGLEAEWEEARKS